MSTNTPQTGSEKQRPASEPFVEVLFSACLMGGKEEVIARLADVPLVRFEISVREPGSIETSTRVTRHLALPLTGVVEQIKDEIIAALMVNARDIVVPREGDVPQ